MGRGFESCLGSQPTLWISNDLSHRSRAPRRAGATKVVLLRGSVTGPPSPNTGAELLLGVRSSADGDKELALLRIDSGLNSQYPTLVCVGSLIKE